MKRFISNLVLGLGLLLSLVIFFSLLKKLFWGFDLLTHFYLQYAVLLGLAIIVILLVEKDKRRWRAFLLIPALYIVLLNIAPFFIPQNTADANSPTLKAISLNLYYHNPNTQAIADYEATPEMMQVLKTELGTIYPHIQDSSRRGAFGIALLSKKPLDIAQTFNLRSQTARRAGQSIYTVVDGVHIVGMHPLPPLNNYYSETRNNELTGLKSFVEGLLRNDKDSPIILLGDFNASPWSWPLEKIIQDTPIQHASLGKGLWPTWRIYGKGTIAFGAPIDHILVSDNLSTHTYKTKLVTGSDHSAVIAELVLP